MKVRELRALMEWLDDRGVGPDETVLFDASMETVTVVRVHGGMHQPVFEDAAAGELHLTQADKAFLRSLRIPM